MIHIDLEEFSEFNKNDIFAVDGSEFVKINDVAYWVIGLINTNTKNIRLETTLHRDADTLKLIITKHIKRGNRIVSDGGCVILGYLLIILDMYISHISMFMDILDTEKSQQVISKVFGQI